MSESLAPLSESPHRTMRACASTYVAMCGALGILLAWFVGVAVVKGAHVGGLIALVAAALAFFVVWASWFRIELSAEGIAYRSPFGRAAAVHWSEITSVQIGYRRRRTRGPYFMLIETQKPADAMTINIKVFGRADLAALASAILRHSPNAVLDPTTQRMSQGHMPSVFGDAASG